jgi:hypothetical protein
MIPPDPPPNKHSTSSAIDWAELSRLAAEDERTRAPYFWKTHTPQEVARAKAAALAMPNRAEVLAEEDRREAETEARRRAAALLAELRPALDEHVKDLAREVLAEDLAAALHELREGGRA